METEQDHFTGFPLADSPEWLRSDLASECVTSISDLPDGASGEEGRTGDFSVSRLHIRTKEASDALGKACGHYVTFSCGNLCELDREETELLARLIAGELAGMAVRLTGKSLNADFGVFVAGLGNRELTVDAIGPATVGKLTATRHLRATDRALYEALDTCSVTLLSAGVTGQTGMESAELIGSAVSVVRPDLILAVDALVARDCGRLAATVQITDAGISPGSGVGNHRNAVTRETLGVPVIAVGLPTVISSATLVLDALREAGIEKANERLRAVLETGKSFFVAPRDSDAVTARAAALFSRAIGLAFAKGLATELGDPE